MKKLMFFLVIIMMLGLAACQPGENIAGDKRFNQVAELTPEGVSIGFDLIVEDIEVTPASPNETYPIQVRMAIKNQGDKAIRTPFNFTLTCKNADQGTVFFKSQVHSGVFAPGVVKWYTMWTYSDPLLRGGQYSLVAKVDTLNQIDEGRNEKNNGKTEPLSIYDNEDIVWKNDVFTVGVDSCAREIQFTGWVNADDLIKIKDIAEGETYEVNYDQNGYGTLTLQGYDYTLRYIEGTQYLKLVDVFPECIGDTPRCYDSDGGMNFNVSGYVQGNDENGTQYHLDDYCILNSNNLREYYCQGDLYQLASYNCPHSCNDGACQAEWNQTFDLLAYDIYWTPANPETGQQINISYQVKNIGDTTVGQFFNSVGFGVAWYPWVVYAVDSLAPGAVHTHTETRLFNITSVYLLDMTVDMYNNISESDEDNNFLLERMNVTGDITDLVWWDIKWSNAQAPQVGETFNISFQLKNRGTTTVTGFTNRYCIENWGYCNYYSVSDLVAPGAIHTFYYPFTCNATGTYYLNHDIDVYDDINEDNENNNYVEEQLETGVDISAPSISMYLDYYPINESVAGSCYGTDLESGMKELSIAYRYNGQGTFNSLAYAWCSGVTNCHKSFTLPLNSTSNVTSVEFRGIGENTIGMTTQIISTITIP